MRTVYMRSTPVKRDTAILCAVVASLTPGFDVVNDILFLLLRKVRFVHLFL